MILIRSRDLLGRSCLYALRNMPELLGDCCEYLRGIGHTQIKLIPELEAADMFNIISEEIGQAAPEQLLAGAQLKLPIREWN